MTTIMKDMPQYYHPKIIPMITHYLEPLLPGTKHKETTKLVITSINAPGRRKIPRNMINYTRNKLRINLVFCRTYTGRLLRFNAVLKTSPAPAMELIFNEFHKKLHCRLGPQQYINDQMRDQHSSPSWNTSSYTTKRVYTNQEASRI